MNRRSSINEDFIRRHSATPDRVSIALESLALISDPDNPSKYGSTQKDSFGYDNDNTQQERSVSERLLEEAAILKDELFSMITLAIPVIATYLLEIVPGMITIFLVGRMDNGDDNVLHLDAAALGVMFFNIVGLSTGFGLLTALDTLCASAHGAGEPSKMGKYLLTGITVMTITFCIVGSILYNTASILLFFGLDQSVADNAGIFVNVMLPGLPFLYAYESLRKLSQARNETMPMVLAAIMSVLVNILMGYYLVSYSRWGWLGAALARTLGYLVLFPTLFFGMWITDREFLSHMWQGFRVKEAITFKAIKKFLNLGVPGMAQLMFEWCAFEIIALLCGVFPDKDYAVIAIGTNAIVFQISTLLFMLYLGASIAGNIRIGNALGAGDVHRAKVATCLSLALGTLLTVLNISILVFFRDRLPYIFTDDEDLIEEATGLFLVVALFQIPDAINAIEQGIFRAIGKQSVAAKLNFIAYYIIGIPLGYVLGFRLGFGVDGLWWGMTAGLCFISTVMSIIVYRCDWQQLCLDTRKRLSIALPRTQNQVG